MKAPLVTAAIAVLCSSMLSGCQSVGLGGGALAANRGGTQSATASVGGNLYRAVEEHVRSQGSMLSDTPHQIAYTDVNDDGLVDVMLLLTADQWCIGESCTLMMFEGTASGAKMLAELTLISSPISVGESIENQWRDIFVTLPGAAGKTSIARISHDGQNYPESPSQWRFLAESASLPGRAVLVGGGASGTDLVGFDRLLAEVDDGVQNAQGLTLDNADPSAEQRFYGRYSWGPGEAYFRPCGGSSVYWVETSDDIAAELDKQYRQIANLQFDDVYLEMAALRKPSPKEGEASFYDGVVEIERVFEMGEEDENTCSQVPAS